MFEISVKVLSTIVFY